VSNNVDERNDGNMRISGNDCYFSTFLSNHNKKINHYDGKKSVSEVISE